MNDTIHTTTFPSSNLHGFTPEEVRELKGIMDNHYNQGIDHGANVVDKFKNGSSPEVSQLLDTISTIIRELKK